MKLTKKEIIQILELLIKMNEDIQMDYITITNYYKHYEKFNHFMNIKLEYFLRDKKILNLFHILERKFNINDIENAIEIDLIKENLVIKEKFLTVMKMILKNFFKEEEKKCLSICSNLEEKFQSFFRNSNDIENFKIFFKIYKECVNNNDYLLNQNNLSNEDEEILLKEAQILKQYKNILLLSPFNKIVEKELL